LIFIDWMNLILTLEMYISYWIDTQRTTIFMIKKNVPIMLTFMEFGFFP